MKRWFYIMAFGLFSLAVFAQAPQQAPQGGRGNRARQQAGAAQQPTFQVAPERQKQFEEMQLKRIAFFTKEIGLTPEEAQSFWPVYNEITFKRWRINHELSRLLRPVRENSNRTIDYEKINKRILQLREENADLDRQCYEKMSAILGQEKLFKYYLAEDVFTRDILNNFERPANPQPANPQPVKPAPQNQ